MSAKHKTTCTNCWSMACREWRDICTVETCPCKCKTVWNEATGKLIESFRAKLLERVEGLRSELEGNLEPRYYEGLKHGLRMASGAIKEVEA